MTGVHVWVNPQHMDASGGEGQRRGSNLEKSQDARDTGSARAASVIKLRKGGGGVWGFPLSGQQTNLKIVYEAGRVGPLRLDGAYAVMAEGKRGKRPFQRKYSNNNNPRDICQSPAVDPCYSKNALYDYLFIIL